MLSSKLQSPAKKREEKRRGERKGVRVRCATFNHCSLLFVIHCETTSLIFRQKSKQHHKHGKKTGEGAAVGKLGQVNEDG